ncbi:MAG: hypothetical protein F6J87_15225 [Spirulina sp. SIO3F2]|nr:hypothetical protein [Spirulina sp. SIO3F2]
MMLAQQQHWSTPYLAQIKSFLVWSFTLTVCLLVVGFPLVFLMATIAVLATVILQFVLPASAVLIVAGGILGSNVLVVLLGATLLTVKGIHPEEVRWLHWLHGNPQSATLPLYASCPLTCELRPGLYPLGSEVST